MTWALVISKFNQAGLEFSTIAVEPTEEGVLLRFGGAGTHAGDPSALRSIAPGATVKLGVTRYESIQGGYEQAAYAFRGFLDEQGCRFPPGFDPPVHWNELYDTPEWNLVSPGSPPGRRMTRPVAYTRELMEREAEKAVLYGCQALYLDPGWDTDFGTFLWGESWLGPRRSFVQDMKSRHGLGVSLHCPLSTWMSTDGRAVPTWPRDSWRMRQDGTVVDGAVCLGSRQYLDEASRRLGEHCADGVGFLMFDGNAWNGGCWNPSHGHPVPYTKEDHVRANVELARRIHGRHPDVIIEMHDPIAEAILWSLQSRSLATGGRLSQEEAVPRYTPVYYKHGLPGSYNEIWGFELMWQCMEDLRDGRARSLYYHNLGCNVPVYLHIDLRDDNEHCVVLWWYASTCRHPGHGRDPRRPGRCRGAEAGHAHLPGAGALLQARRFLRDARGGPRSCPARRRGIRGEPLQPVGERSDRRGEHRHGTDGAGPGPLLHHPERRLVRPDPAARSPSAGGWRRGRRRSSRSARSRPEARLQSCQARAPLPGGA